MNASEKPFLVAVAAAAVALVLLLQSSAFSFNSGNWYYAAFTQNPAANYGSCNFAPVYYAYNAVWRFFEALGADFRFFWLFSSLAVAAAGAFLQFKWVKLASGNETLAVAASAFSFFLTDLSTPLTLASPRYLTFFVLMPCAYYALFSARINGARETLEKLEKREKRGASEARKAREACEPARIFGVRVPNAWMLSFAVLVAAMIASHVLFACFFLLSVAFFYAGLALSKKPLLFRNVCSVWNGSGGLKAVVFAVLLAFVLASPELYRQVSSRLYAAPTPSYAVFEDWGVNVLGFWVASPAKVFYSFGPTVFLLSLLALSVYASLKIVFELLNRKSDGKKGAESRKQNRRRKEWQREEQRIEGRNNGLSYGDFEVFVASNVLFTLLLFFTPLGYPLAKLFLPGAFVEQFLKIVPFHLTVPLVILELRKTWARKTRARRTMGGRIRGAKTLASRLFDADFVPCFVLLVLSAFVLAYPMYAYSRLVLKPLPSAKDFLGAEPKDVAAESAGGTVLTDIYSSYLLQNSEGLKAIAVNTGYNVCLTKKNFEEMDASNKLFSGRISPAEANQIFFEQNVSTVFLTPSFWRLNLSKQPMGGVRYPSSFEDAVRVFEGYGLEKRVLSESVVFKTSARLAKQ